MRLLLIVLAAFVVLCAAWWWLGDPSSTTATGSSATWTAYAGLPAPRALTRPDVSPTTPGRHDRIVVSFKSRRATGVFGTQRRAYRVRAATVHPASTCANARDRLPPSRPAGFRLRAVLDPARGDGGPLGWCPGRYRGTVTYVSGHRTQIAARFSFTVR
jgi:hypothetical protein